MGSNIGAQSVSYRSRGRINLTRSLPLLVGMLTVPFASADVLQESSGQPAMLDLSIPEIPAMIAAYQRTFAGMTYSQAYAAVEGSSRRRMLRDRAIAELPAVYGGSWYDPIDDVLHLSVVGDASAIRLLAQDAGVPVQLHTVRYTLRELERRASEVNLRLRSLRLDGVAVAQQRSNRVILATTGTGADAVRRASLGLDPAVSIQVGSPPLLECGNRYACGTPARGGTAIGIDRDGAGSGGADYSPGFCSLGFTAKAADGSRWILTAGHCSKGIVVNCPSSIGCWGHGGQYFGPMRQAYDYAAVDVGRIRLDNQYWKTGGYMYNARKPTAPVDVDGYVGSRSSIDVNETVCLSAVHAVLGQSCGVIRDDVATSRGLVEVDYDACPDDSGGGWYWLEPGSGRRIAYGIHHGAGTIPGGCAAGGTSTFSTIPDIHGYFDSSSPGSYIRVETR